MARLLNYKPEGFALVEAIISLAIGLVFVLSFSTLLLYTSKVSKFNTQNLKAIFYLRETAEVAKDLEMSNWSELAASTCSFPKVCHPQIQNGAWKLVTGTETLDGIYRRSISVSQVNRNAAFNIVSSGGTPDPNTFQITTSLSWTSTFGTKTSGLNMYVHNLPKFTIF